jgi:hypothetical protein
VLTYPGDAAPRDSSRLNPAPEDSKGLGLEPVCSGRELKGLANENLRLNGLKFNLKLTLKFVRAI